MASHQLQRHHPLGLKPLGNTFFDRASTNIRDSGLGLFSSLTDDQLLSLLDFFSGDDLCAFTSCSKAAFAFGSHEELWFQLALDAVDGRFCFSGSWRLTWLSECRGVHERGGSSSAWRADNAAVCEDVGASSSRFSPSPLAAASVATVPDGWNVGGLGEEERMRKRNKRSSSASSGSAGGGEDEERLEVAKEDANGNKGTSKEPQAKQRKLKEEEEQEGEEDMNGTQTIGDGEKAKHTANGLARGSREEANGPVAMEIEEDEVKENRGAATSVQTNDTHSTNKPARRPYRSPTSTYLSLRGLYSDILFQRWLCANVELLPQWLRTNNLQRVKASELDVPTFISKFEEKNLPVVIEGAASSWPSVGKWGRDLFLSEHGDAQFLCGPVRMKFRDFATYMDRSKDDSPMFIFDPKFADSDVAPDLAGDFQPLEYFSDDLFTLLPQRPNYRWLLYGAKRSGSKWHIDPNMTSAWNAVVKGSKRWMMLPPGVTPPGVFPSPDGAEVTQPVSLVEWYLNFYEAAKDKSNTCGYTLLETTVHAGDVIFVPRGWWHAVLNVEDETIAITQNFVSPRALKHVRSFLHNRKEQISGVPESRRSTLGDEFDAALRRERPELMRGEEGDGGGGATSIEGDGGEGPSSGASCSFNRLSSLLAARKQSRGSGENPVVSNGCLETERQSCSAPGHLETPSTNPPTSHATDQETTGSLFGEDREVPDASQPPPPAAGSRDQTAGFSFWKRLQEKGGGGGWG